MKRVLITISASIKNESLNSKQLKFYRRGIFTLLASLALFTIGCQKQVSEHNRITGIEQLTHPENSTSVADIEFRITDFSAPAIGIKTTVSANGDKIFSTFTRNASDAEGRFIGTISN